MKTRNLFLTVHKITSYAVDLTPAFVSSATRMMELRVVILQNHILTRRKFNFSCERIETDNDYQFYIIMEEKNV